MIARRTEPNHTAATLWAKRCVLAGLVVLAISLAFVPWNPTRSCGGSSAPPILGFELATSADDLRGVFGPEGPCRAAMVSAMRIVNWIDFGYMASYGAFLFCGVAVLRARNDTALSRLAMLAAVLAPLADAVENACLLTLDVGAPDGRLGVLMVASRTKFLMLAVVASAIGIETWRREVSLRRAFAFAQLPAPLVLLASITVGAAMVAIVPVVTVSWLALLAWAALLARRPRAAPVV